MNKRALKVIQQGAEAIIYLDKSKKFVIKNRIKKSYRNSELDTKIRKARTNSETKLLEKASYLISAPKPLIDSFNKNNFELKIPYIDGKKLSDNLNKFPLLKQKIICKKIGESISKLHSKQIIHGDLTTSNLILKNNEIFFIDFGLGFISNKIEDKAVDVHLFKEALEAKHFKNWKILFNEFLKGYSSNSEYKKVIERLTAIERRGRYRN